jgi:hypothetical protein
MLRLSTRAAAIAAMVVASSLGTVALTSGVASASAPTVTCTKFSATASGSATLGGCNDTKNTGGSGKEVAKVKGSGGTAVITWNKTGTTTTTFKYASVTPNKCPKGYSEIKETATVTGGTGAAVKSIPKGQVGVLLLCIKGTTITLLKGQQYKI